MSKKTFRDSDILAAMQREVDKTSVVYGANGHYSTGAYYDLYGDGYNKEATVKAAEDTKAAQGFMEETDEEKLAKGLI